MVSTDFIDYYELLEIPFGATDADIKTAYRRMARAFHPDMHPEDNDFYTEKFKEITEAYEVLSHPFKRGNYDVSYRRIVLQEFPEYEHYEDPTPEDTTVYTHKYTKRNNGVRTFVTILILLAITIQLVWRTSDNLPITSNNSPFMSVEVLNRKIEAASEGQNSKFYFPNNNSNLSIDSITQNIAAPWVPIDK